MMFGRIAPCSARLTEPTAARSAKRRSTVRRSDSSFRAVPSFRSGPVLDRRTTHARLWNHHGIPELYHTAAAWWEDYAKCSQKRAAIAIFKCRKIREQPPITAVHAVHTGLPKKKNGPLQRGPSGRRMRENAKAGGFARVVRTCGVGRTRRRFRGSPARARRRIRRQPDTRSADSPARARRRTIC